MNHHEGVVCNGCMKANFQGLCYRCLTCRDFDLCSECYERDFITDEHPFDHPMKCVLTQMDIELYFGGEYITGDPPQSYRCPYCKEWGFNESTFLSHAAEMHPNACPQLISTMVSLYEQQQAARIFLEEEQLMAHAAATTARNRVIHREVGLELTLHELNPDGTIRESGSEETEENNNDGNTNTTTTTTTNNNNNNNSNSNINVFGQPTITGNENRAIRFRIRPRRNRTGGNGSVGSSDDVSGSRGGGNTSSGDSNTNVSERIERSTGGGIPTAVQNSISHLRNVLRRHSVRQIQQHPQTGGRNSAVHLTLPSIPEHNNTRSTRSNDSIFGSPERLRLAVSDSERPVNVFMPRHAALDTLIQPESSQNANDSTNPTQATLNEMMRLYSSSFGAITNETTNRVRGGNAGAAGGAGGTGINTTAAAAGYSVNRSGNSRRTRLRILPDPIAIQSPPFEISRERVTNFSRAIATLPTNGQRPPFVSLLNDGQRISNGGNHSNTIRARSLRPISPSYRQRDNHNHNNNNANNIQADLLNGNLTLTAAGPYRLAITNNTNDANNINNNLSNAALQARNIIFLRNVDDELRIIDELNLSQVHLPIWPIDEMDSTHNNNSNSVPVNIVPAAAPPPANDENDDKNNEDKEKYLLNAYLKPQEEDENYSKFQENRSEFVSELVMSALRDTELDFPEKFLLSDTMPWSQEKKSLEISATVGAGDGGATLDSTSHVSPMSEELNDLEPLLNETIGNNVDDVNETVHTDDEFPEEFI